MREPINWKDHVVEYPGRFKETNLGNSLVQHEASPGEIRQQGTPQNAANFNEMDLAAFEAAQMGSHLAAALAQTDRGLSAVKGFSVDVTLTNTLGYPFNNSKKTVPISDRRSNTDYYIYPEVLESVNGAVGDIEFSDKLLNGFKINYTGSAESIRVRCYVTGGM